MKHRVCSRCNYELTLTLGPLEDGDWYCTTCGTRTFEGRCTGSLTTEANRVKHLPPLPAMTTLARQRKAYERGLRETARAERDMQERLFA